MKNRPPKSKIAFMIEEYWRKKNLEKYYNELKNYKNDDNIFSLRSSNSILKNNDNQSFRNIYNPNKYSRLNRLKPIREYDNKKRDEERKKEDDDFYDYYSRYYKKKKEEEENKKEDEENKKEKNFNKVVKKNNLDLSLHSNKMNKLISTLDKEEEKTYKEIEDTKSLLKLLIDYNNKEYDRLYKETEDLLYSKNYFNPDYPEYKKNLLYDKDYLKIGNFEDENIIKEKINIKIKIENLQDLINLCDVYPEKKDIEYNINMEGIRKIKPYLQEMQNLIGMKSLKENVVDQILYYVQNFHKILGPTSQANDYMHTVIYGPPGTGKTEVAKIMGKIFSNLGVLKNGIFKKVTRDDLIAGYLGQTATKTKDVIKSCRGGVLFIDEAYALGNVEKRDSFSKECIDTLCEALSDMRGEIMCIIAGYEKELNDCFFSYNEGLESRFTWRFNIDEYNGEEMNDIFMKKVDILGWNLAEKNHYEWFNKNMSYFKYFGRDMETLLTKTKIAHSRRVFCLDNEEKGILTKEDLEKGLKMFLSNDSIEKRKEKENFNKYLQNTLYL